MENYIATVYNGGTISLQLTEGSEYAQKLKTLLASGMGPDVFRGTGVLYPELQSNDALLPLNDYLGTVLAGAYAKVPEDLYKAVTVDGKIYGIIPFKDLVENNSVLYDAEQLKAAGVEMHSWNRMPDLDDVLYAMREFNDKTYPERHDIPVSAFYNLFYRCYCLENIGGANSTIVSNFKDLNYVDGYEAGKDLFCMYDTPEFVDHVKRLTQLVTDRIYPYDRENYDKDGVYRKSGEQIFFYSQGYLFAPDNQTNYADGHICSLEMQNVSLSYTGYTIAVTQLVNSDTDNPEEACALIEILSCDPYLGTTLRFGYENTHWRLTADGKQVDTTAGDIKDSGYKYWYGVQLGDITNCILPTDVAPTFHEALEELNANAIYSPLLGFNVNTSKVDNQLAAIAQTCSEYLSTTTLYSGMLTDAETDSMVEEFVGKLKANGVEDVLKEFQSQLDAWLG
jgi:putative aldouronate transport system substrate-binding protein